MRTIIHFEGIPGSGKSTASEKFCALLKANGIDASWWREEAPNHPITKNRGRADPPSADFSQKCLDAWLTFQKLSNGTAILDGYALQSTVRFLYANGIARTQIESYFNKWQGLTPESMLVYFFVENPDEHYEVVLAERGNEWSRKLYSYIERSPIGVANGLRGRAGFVEFWSNYQQLCLQLLEDSRIPVCLVGSRSWDDDGLKRLAVRTGLLADQLQ